MAHDWLLACLQILSQLCSSCEVDSFQIVSNHIWIGHIISDERGGGGGGGSCMLRWALLL